MNTMKRRWMIAAALGLALSSPPARATLIVDYWDLGTGVIDSSGPDGTGTDVIQNPYQVTDKIVHGFSEAHTAYNFAWTDTAGTFSFHVSNTAAGTDPELLRSISSGYIDFASNSDLLFSSSGAYGYQLPVGEMQVGAGFNLIKWVGLNSPLLLTRGGEDDTFVTAPRSGSIALDGAVSLPAGQVYRLQYDFETRTFGPVGSLATGSGDFTFTLTEVPEPASILPFMFMVVLARPRRARR